MKTYFLAAVLLTLALLPNSARSQQAGKFDYYLLNLSWSPEFCSSHPTSPECSKHLGLVVHGLWPQYNNANSGPQNCGTQAGPANPSGLLDIFPTLYLIQHEWTTHGTCSGLSANDYFALIRSIFTKFHPPSQLQSPTQAQTVRADVLKQAIAQANGMAVTEIALTCTGGYLKEVEVCYTKDGKPQPCAGLRQCPSGSLRIPAVQ